MPERIKGMMNGVHLIYNQNSLLQRSFDYFGFWHSNKYQDFENEIKSETKLTLKVKQILGQDTILTIEYTDQLFDFMLHTLITVNLSNKAITKIVNGNIWDSDDDFTEVHFRDIDGTYYPFYFQTVSQYEFNKRTSYQYNKRSLIFYQIINNKSQFQKYKRKQKMKKEKNIRDFKYSYNPEFWDNYIHSNKLATTEVIKAELGRKRNLEKEFMENQR